MPDIMTTRDSFPVVDITHKPKRTQGDNIKAIQSEEFRETTSEGSTVPRIVTLERAIDFYESNSSGELSSLYLQTAKWLREFMSKSVPVVSDEMDIRAKELFDKARGR